MTIFAFQVKPELNIDPMGHFLISIVITVSNLTSCDNQAESAICLPMPLVNHPTQFNA
jgi:hypothetical protein